MIDERAHRRTSFQGATSIQLADGQHWWLPEVTIEPFDAVARALVEAVALPADEPEASRDEWALAMWFLSRNYRLQPEHYAQLLGFAKGDPNCDALRTVLRRLARSATLKPRPELVPNLDRMPRPTRRWGLAAATSSLAQVRSRWSLRSH